MSRRRQFTADLPGTDGYYWWLQRGQDGFHGGLARVLAGESGWLCADGRRRNVANADGPLHVQGQPVWWSRKPVDPSELIS